MNIPTAEEFLKNFHLPSFNMEDALIGFATLHVQKALEEAVKKHEIIYYTREDGDYAPFLNENSILNAYPLDNIK